MEAQAQEEMEREVACDVEVEWAPMRAGSTHRMSLFADVGDDSIRRVYAELLDYQSMGAAGVNAATQGESLITTEARRIDGRTLVYCGYRGVGYDDEGRVVDEEFWIYRWLLVRTSSSL